ncbi:glycosyltransferase family 2 protein [Cognatishimia sp.]|uniref:glycosyltransferase n=1 Tax=Cognatishimia sp. TaxID=2211648 RepID=UPI0035182E6E
MTQDTPTVAVVAIGRNEGQRLVDCLASLQGKVARVVYVDSGSVDMSVQNARDVGAEVVELSSDRPFTAARGRAAGYAHLKTGEMPDYVQFIDGDCRVDPDWIARASSALDADMELGLVTGWRRERFPEASLYNDLCHDEWNRPEGLIETCGGDIMVRPAAYEEAGGFDETVIAAEDDEFCVRMRKAGWLLRRIPYEMTYHDAGMTRFSQWWQRAVRSGHGFAQVGHMHPPYFAKEQKRVVLYGGAVPLAALILWLVWPVTLVLIAAVYGLNYVRTVKGLTQAGMETPRARRHGLLLTLSKFPNILGMGMFHYRRLKGRHMQIIEYK